MSKRETGAERRARLEEMQKAQRAEQRKRTLLTAGIGLAAGALIIGGTGFYIWSQEQDKPRNQALSTFGVAEADAGCTDVQDSEPTGGSEHVTTHVDYDTAPPSSGKHNPQWMGYPGGPRNFYTVKDAPPVERLVHNLEHGHNIVWYLPTIDQAELDTLEQLSEKFADDNKTYKFIVAPWDTARGDYPEGMTIGISHWGREKASVQHCAKVSGEAIGAFVDAHPITDAPEPDAP